MVTGKGNRKSEPEVPSFGDQTIVISRLHLDPLNPRHDPLESDADVIKQLCNAEMVAALAQDIAKRGSLSPLDVLGVIPFEGNPGHFIAVEGNRRTCALILLSDPGRAPNASLQTQFRKLAQSTNVPRAIKVHVFPSREEAKPWIDLRHLGPQGGIGTVEWDADQKTRAAGSNSRTSSRANTLALMVLDRLETAGLITAQQRSAVSLTTITRYLGTPGVRAILGLGSSSELIYTHDVAEVDLALQRLVLDSIQASDDGAYRVHSRSGSPERVTYANTLKTDGTAPKSQLPAPEAPPPVEKAAMKAVPRSTKRSASNPSNRPNLINRSFTVASPDKVLSRIRAEALSLSLDEFPFAGSYLLRSLVEQTMVLFLKKRSKYNPNANDQLRTQTCAEELAAMGVTGKALKVIRKAGSDKDTHYSLDSLGNALHGGSIPTRQSLIANFDTWEPSLRAMLDSL